MVTKDKTVTDMFQGVFSLLEQNLLRIKDDNQILKDMKDKINLVVCRTILRVSYSDLNAMRSRYYRTLGQFTKGDAEAEEIFGIVEIPQNGEVEKLLNLCKQIGKLAKENIDLAELILDEGIEFE